MHKKTLGLFTLLALFLGACMPGGDDKPETEEKAYLRGQRLLKEGRQEDALEAFCSVIEKRKAAPEAHLEAGQLYLSYFHDPVMAIYHFRQYLTEKPNTSQAPMVKQLIETARKAFAKDLPGSPFSEDFDRLDLLDVLETQRAELEVLRKDNAVLKERLASLEASKSLEQVKISAFPSAKTEIIDSKRSSSQSKEGLSSAKEGNLKTYVVQAGDTLSKISGRVYGTPVRWKEIYELNRDQLKTPHDLKLGQTLQLP